jgi:hypothetical protein
MFYLLPSCRKVNGKGPLVSEERQATAFSTLHYSIGGTLYFQPSNRYHLEIRAQRNILDVIETYVSGNELNIRLRNNTVIHSHEPIDVYVEAPDIRGIALSGSGNIFIQQPIQPQQLKLESSGSGNMQLEAVDTRQLECRISGSGEMAIRSGRTGREKISISGSGNVDLSGVQSDSAETRTSGSGNISLWVNTYLDSEISGSGTVRYKGHPQIKVKVSGSGKVVPW